MMSGYGGGPGGGDWSFPPAEDVDWTATPSSSAAISAPMKQSQPPAPPSTRQQLSAPFIPDNSQCFKAIYKRGGNRGKYYVAPQTQDNVDPFLVPPECDADEETLAEKLNQKVIESKPTGFDWGQAEPIREEDVPKPTIGSDWDDWGAPSLEKKAPPAAADPPVPTTAQPVPSSSGYCGGGSKDAAPVRQPQRPQKQPTQDIPTGWQTVLSPTPSRNDWATPANAATPPRMINTAPANSSPSDGFRRRWNNNEGDSNRGGGSYNDQPQQTPFQDRATNATPGQGGGRWNNTERDSNRGGGYNARPQQQQPPTSPAQPKPISNGASYNDWGAPPQATRGDSAPVEPSQPAPSNDNWGAPPSVEMKAAPQDWSAPPPPAPAAPAQTSQQQYNAPSGWNNNERDLNRRGGSYNDQPQQRPFQDRATTAAPGQGGGRWNNERDSNRGGSYNARPQQQPKSYSSDGIDWGAPPATVEDSKAPAPVEPSQPAPSNDNWGAPPSVEMKAAPQDWSAPPPPAPAAPVQTSQQQYNAPRGWNNNERDSNRGGGSYNDQPQQRPFQDRATNATPGQGGGRWNNNERDSNRGGGYNARPQQFHDRAPQPQRAPEPAGTGEWIEWGTPPEQLQQSNWQQAPRGGGGYRNDGDRWNNNNERYSNRGRGGGGYNARPQQQQTQMVSIQEDPNVDWSRV